MKTRSQTQRELSENEFKFNFDQASQSWLENKIRLGNGCYKYKPVNKAARPQVNTYHVQTRSQSNLYL